MRLTSTHFGVFVIFAAIYAAGTLALGRLPIGDVQIKPGEIAVPLVALFGFSSVIGVVFGMFIANMASPLGPLDLTTPAVAFFALLILRFLAKRSILPGVAAYYVIVSVWVGFLTSIATGRGDAFTTVFISQGIAIAIGTALYFVVKSRMPKPVQPQAVET
ncbi:MAG: QueT transporter family protein [Candidatus Caldarchaeum sp.]|nr:QueT transporter family protein [Candidatus Caldarchaeum sp.]MCS7137608.1 QueT transporter family protein [Candidatus Caldarchaeum sp.]MDW7978056.1 QueT transporter family protein [Candidatus Caldarchaeum sp.]MDW8359174.1 QueT transporter family protein [Candidatus Caldarchaeum sp.]